MQCASLDCGKKSLKVYRVRRGVMDSVFYMLVNCHEGWEGRGPVLKIRASRSTRFLTWRHLKVYLHGIMYKTKLLSNGCKQQIDNKYMKKAGHYLYCKFNWVFFRWNTSTCITVHSGWCLILLLLHIINLYTQFRIMAKHVVSSKIKSNIIMWYFLHLKFSILTKKHWFKKLITTISTCRNKNGFINTES